MNDETIISALKSLDFTEYEAKIYITLLKQHPQNGNTIAQLSGVPSSKVYETLRKMQEKGYVFLVISSENSNKKRYSPLSYKKLLEISEEKFTENLDFINKSLEKSVGNWDGDWTELFSIEGYDPSIEGLKSEIENATSEIVMSCWDKEFNILFPFLLEAHERSVKVTTISFDDNESKSIPWNHFIHAQTSKSSERHIGELSLVTDHKKAIIFESASEFPNSVISSHFSMIKMLNNYIRHDIYLSRIYADLKEEIQKIYGENLQGIYDSSIK